MIITCSECDTSFNLDSSLIKKKGSKVRCSVCAKIFTVYPPEKIEEPPSFVEPEKEQKPEPMPESTVTGAEAPVEDQTPPAVKEEPDAQVVEKELPDQPAPVEDAVDTDQLPDDKPSSEAAESFEPSDLADEPELSDERGVQAAAPEEVAPEAQPDSAVLDETKGAPDAQDTLLADIESVLDGGSGEKDTPAEDDLALDFDADKDADDASDVDDSLDFDLDFEPDTGDAPEDSSHAMDADDTLLADIEDVFGDQDEMQDAGMEAVEVEDIDLDIDEGSDEEPAGADNTGMSELDDLELSFDLEDDGVPESADVAEADDELDLDLDFDLEPAEDAQADAGDGAAASELEDELDLSFNLEPEEEAESADVAEAGDELDLDLDFDLEPAEDAPADDGEEVASLELEDDLELTVDLESEKLPEASVKESGELTIDSEDTLLADISDVLGDSESTEEKDADEDLLEDLDLELSKDMEPSEPGSEEDLEDLEFELDMEFDDAEAGSDDAEDEIDLSDIEDMLEGPADSGDADAEFDDSEESIVIEKSLETEKWLEDSDDDLTGEDGEINLAEIEEVLDEVDLEGPEEIEEMEEEPELELDFDGEQSAGDTASEELRLSDFDDTLEGQDDMVSSISQDAGDIKLEFEFDDEEEEEAEDEGMEATVAVPETEDIETSMGPKPELRKKTPKRKPAPKKGVSKVLVFLLVIVALLGGLAGTYYILDQKGIDIPYVSDYLKPKVPDNGTQNLTTYDINSRFVENEKAGKLFVITGKVKNGYATATSMIRLTGRLFSSGKTPAGTQIVSCGNMISDLELASLELTEINKRLSNRFGDNRSNSKIRPGQSIPFMVVFSGLPENLEEFTIEVAGSTVLQ